MIEANNHLRRSSATSSSRSRLPTSPYDSSRIAIFDEKNKKPPQPMIVGVTTWKAYRYDAPYGIINRNNWVGSLRKEGGSKIRITGFRNTTKEVKAMLNKNMLVMGNPLGKGNFYRGYFTDKENTTGTCELSDKELPVQTHEWISDSFTFKDYAEAHLDEDFFQRALSEDKKIRRDAMYSMFVIESEEGEGYTGQGDEKVQYLKKFKVKPEMTPFLSDLQREWIENLFPVKTVKSKGIQQAKLNAVKSWIGAFYFGRRRSGSHEWVGIPALIRVLPNLVAVHHIVDTTYDEKNDSLSYQWDDTIVSIDYLKGINDKKSPNYQRFIVDRKVANEKAIGVTDMHRNACKVCGKRDHNAKNCDIWDYGAKPMKEAWDSSVGFAKAMPDLEFTVFIQPLPLNRKSTQYGVKTLLKTNLYVGDSRKPVATLVLWGNEADDYLDWMNSKTLGASWAKSQTKKEDLQEWYRENGGVDSLTHDRLILKAHDAWVKRPKYKNKEAWAIQVGINPRKGGYLEWTGEAYKFVPKDERTNVDDMYERTKISTAKRIIG